MSEDAFSHDASQITAAVGLNNIILYTGEKTTLKFSALVQPVLGFLASVQRL